MTTAQNPKQLTLEEFQQEANALGNEFLAVLKGRTLPTGVVLQALMDMHRYVASQLPSSAQGELSIAMAAYAGELLQKSAPGSPSQTTH